MPPALTPDYALRIVNANNRFKLQYRQTDEQGEHRWITVPIINKQGEYLGNEIEVIMEMNNER
jgi:hypothetical protein